MGPRADANASYASCPVTDTLAARLNAVHAFLRAEPLCRCPNVWQTVTITTDPLPGSTGAIAHVALNFGAGIEKLDVTVLRTAGGWFANDTSCTGKDPATTSIYANPPPPC